MAISIQFDRTGGPDVLHVVGSDPAPPGLGEVRLRQRAVGLNYIDIYYRSGLYPTELPSGIGLEGAGVVEQIGDGVTGFAVGDRVAYCAPPLGAYATLRNMPADRLVHLPDSIDFETAAAMMLKGITAQYLLRRTFPVQAGQMLLLHAAAGGVGLILTQWARHLGATVIGTVSSQEKAELARENGCEHTIIYTKEDFAERVRSITGGKGVPVVYDSIGRETFQGSLDCLSPFGLMVSYGNSSGPVPPVPLTALKGSLFITRPSVMAYTAQRADLVASANELFDVVGSGHVRIDISRRYPLAEAAEAQHELEGRRTTGSTVLLP